MTSGGGFIAGSIIGKLLLDKTGWNQSIQEVTKDTGGLVAKVNPVTGAIKSLAGQFAIGTIAANLITKSVGNLANAFRECIKGAIEEEKAERALAAAIEITGRSVATDLKYYMDFAQAQMKVTTFTHEQVQATQTLLLQLTKLGRDGIDKATKGAMGLATTLGIDLHSATMMVTKAMEGNYTVLQRVGIRVNENLKGEEKQAAMLELLLNLYKRSTAETDTFGGAVMQLTNQWREAKESIGRAITDNEELRKGIKSVTEAIADLVASGKLTAWATAVIQDISTVVKWFRDLTTATNYAAEIMRGGWFVSHDAEIDAARETAEAFRKELQVFTPTMEKLRGVMEMGPAYWKEWSESVKATDAILAANKDTIVAWIDKGVAWLGLTKDLSDGTNALGAMLKQFGLKTKTDLTKELDEANAALSALRGSMTESTPGAVKALEEKIAELKEQMTGVKIETKSLADQLGITFRSETVERVKKLNDALLFYRGKLTTEQVDKIREEIEKLSGTLKLNLIPAADEVAKHVDAGLAKIEEMALKVNSEIEKSVDFTAENMASDLDAIVKGWKKTAEEGKAAAEVTKDAWAETTDQMAKAFGEAFANIIRDGLNFADFFKNLMQGIVNVVATFVGKQLSTLFTNFFTKLGAQAGGAFSGFSASANAAAFGIAAGFAAMWVGIGIGMINSKRQWDDYWDDVIEKARRAGEEIIEVVTVAMLKAGEAVPSGETRRIAGTSEWEKAYKLIADAIIGAVTASKALEDAWSTFLSHAKELGEESSKWLIDLIRNFREAGKESKALNEYVLSWLDTIPAALSVIVDQVKIVTQNLTNLFEGSAREVLGYVQELANTSGRNIKDIGSRLAELGDIAVLTFNAMIASGKSWIDTVDALRPVLSALREKYKQLGIDAGASLAHLFRIVGVTEKHRELFEAIDATRQILIALGNSVWLTAGAWKTLTGDIVSQFHALRHGGLSVEDSLRAMVPSLQAIVNYAAAYGFELDAQTQSLVNQARVHGWIKDAQKTEANILVEGFNRVCDILIKIAEVLGADVSDLMTDISTTAGKFYKTSKDTVTAWKLIGGVLVPFNESLEDAIELAKKLGITVSDIGHGMTPFVTTTGGGTSGFGVSRYQEGGIAWTHQLAEVGELEPEVITPLSKYREPRQALNLTFNVNAIDRAGVETFLRRDAKPIIQRMLDRNDLHVPPGAIGGP